LVAGIFGLVCAVALMAWGLAGYNSSGAPAAPGNDALGSTFAPSLDPSSGSPLNRSELRRTFNGDPVRLRYEVLNQIPGDPESFTQGLEFSPDGRLFESSGLYGRSALRQIDPATGATVNEILVDPTWFAEGITLVEGDGTTEIAMLTWREGVVAFYNPDTLTERRRATYSGEGWGLCQLDDGSLVMSNGTPDLTRRDPLSFAVIKRITVTRSGQALTAINELECVGDLVWANVWKTDQIVVIDPITGEVVAELDASALRDPTTSRTVEVLNGIALIPGTTDEFLLTGKNWPSIWAVRVQPA